MTTPLKFKRSEVDADVRVRSYENSNQKLGDENVHVTVLKTASSMAR